MIQISPHKYNFLQNLIKIQFLSRSLLEVCGVVCEAVPWPITWERTETKSCSLNSDSQMQQYDLDCLNIIILNSVITYQVQVFSWNSSTWPNPIRSNFELFDLHNIFLKNKFLKCKNINYFFQKNLNTTHEKSYAPLSCIVFSIYFSFHAFCILTLIT